MPALAPPCVKPLDLYPPRDPQSSDPWRLRDQHFDTFQQVYLPVGRQGSSIRSTS